MSGIDEQDRQPLRSERNPWRIPPRRFGGGPSDFHHGDDREQRRAREAERRKWEKKRQSLINYRQNIRNILFALVICIGLIPVIIGTNVFITPSNYDTYESYVDATGTFDRIEIYQNDMSENQLIFLADVYKNNDTVILAELIIPDEVVQLVFEVTIGYNTTIKETIMIGGEYNCIHLLDDVYVGITLSSPVIKSEPFVEWGVWGQSILGGIVIFIVGGLFVERLTYGWVREARYSYYDGDNLRRVR